MATLGRFRVLNAILALREFTVADLARYSGIKDTTVRTVLGRDSRFVERDGTQTQHRRGGQPIQYRLRPDTENDLVAILRELEGLGANLPPLIADQEDPVMLSLIAAEDILIRQLPQAGPTDRAELVELATADFEAVQFMVNPEQEEAATHRGVVDLLLRLAEAEQESLTHSEPPNTNAWHADRPATAVEAPCHEAEKKLEALGRDLRKLLTSWPTLGDKNLLPDLIHRISTSQLGQIILRFGTETPPISA
jgi:hypothetical protein